MIAAVLAVFLVAALFIGAGAAATPAAGDTVYVYQFNATPSNTTYYQWVGGEVAGFIKSNADGTFTGEDITAGLYSTNNLTATDLISVKYPVFTLNAYKAGTGTSIAGMSLLKTQYIDFSVSGDNGLVYSFTFTTPAGGSTSDFGGRVWNNSLTMTLTNVSLANVTSGTWSVKGTLKSDSIPTQMAKTTPSKYLDSAKITFTVGAEAVDSISINKDSIVRGTSVLVTVTGTPKTYVNVTINEPGFNLLDGQSGVVGTTDTTGYLDNVRVYLGNSGSKTFQLDSNSTSKDATYTLTAKFTAADKKAKVTINCSSGILLPW